MSVNTRTPALVCSVALHTGVVVLALCPFFSSLPQQQVVDIDVVKISSLERTHDPAPAPATAVPVEQPVPKTTSRMGQLVKPQKLQQSTAASLPPTTGPQTPKATKQIAATIIEPVFTAEYLHNTPPAYPDSARRNGVEGKVTLKVNVGKDGDALEVNIEHSSGEELLDDAALDAVKQWHFAPARCGDETLESNVLVPIEFKLE
jgi:periplasmic protein TonB